MMKFIIVLIGCFILNTKTNNTDNEDSVENEYYQDYLPELLDKDRNTVGYVGSKNNKAAIANHFFF